jgi:hypothetical protein
MIDRQRLLNDLKPLLRELEADLRARCDEVAQINEDLKKEYEQARAADRTGVTFEEWRADLITQVAVAWVLSCVFVRFLEDNSLIEPPRISGVIGQLSVVSCPSSVVRGQDATDHGPRTTDNRLQRARDEWEIYLQRTPDPTHRGYLLKTFDDFAKLPGTKDVFGPHNPVSAYRNWLSGDAAQKLIEFFQKIDTDGTGEILHDFTDPNWDTRFLGDLYQDLSEAARKKYALLQTPVFVEEFILDRTLEPAIKEFGLVVSCPWSVVRGQLSVAEDNGPRTTDNGPRTTDVFKMIDPACGSGHFLLGAFARILKHWRAKEPGTGDRELVNRALASVHGVDLNPYAVAIARFRLLVAAMRECHISRLEDAPAFACNLVCGDSLLHGMGGQQVLGFHDLAHHYQSEDIDELRRILKPGQYHAVVANPPYITVKDKTLNQAYRERYPEVCHRQYSLAVPFLQRLFVLACDGGYTGQITANSFMKREFGKKLVESYLPKIDLTHVIDTSGAYIPGHGTPTVILFGRNRKPLAPTIRAVMGIKGEPSTPDDPAQGLVWSAIVRQIDSVGSQSDSVSVADSERAPFHKHPWSIGGGGAAELKEHLNENASTTLDGVIETISAGICITREDEAYLIDESGLARNRISSEYRIASVQGEHVRDWMLNGIGTALFPYDERLRPIDSDRGRQVHKFLWPYKELLWRRKELGGDHRELERTWWEWNRFLSHRFLVPLSITYGEVATHNHFVFDRGGKIFNRTAPVIKLPASAGEDDHLALLGLLNSSTACFWLRQVCQTKGSSGIGRGVYDEGWEKHFAFNGTKLEQFPLPANRPLALARQLDGLAGLLSDLSPSVLLRTMLAEANREIMAERRWQWEGIRQQMISLQEELDWDCYRRYGLTSVVSRPLSVAEDHGQRTTDDGPRTTDDGPRTTDHGQLTTDHPPPLALGQRAFEIVLARKMAAGEEETTWFARHGSTPITEIPADWPEAYRQLVQRRIETIESNANIALIERPEYKRRWNTEPWDQQQERALRGWLLDRLESYFDFDGRLNTKTRSHEEGNSIPEIPSCLRAFVFNPSLTSVAKVADLARQDKDFMQVAELFTGRMDFDVGTLVGELVADESVPALPVLRYKPTGMDKRAAWERTWELQRMEDDSSVVSGPLSVAGEPRTTDHGPRTSDIPVPPKYTSADFQSSVYWRLRGKLDVPKERWVSFPHCEGEDGTLLIAWAGYDHLQLARAIAERYELAREQEGRQLVPLLETIGQLIPWLKQWHNDLDPAYGTRMGDYFEDYLADEAKALGQSVEQVMKWAPPEKAKKAGRKKK